MTTVSTAAIVLVIVLIVYVGPLIFVSWLLWSAIQRHRDSAPGEEG